MPEHGYGPPICSECRATTGVMSRHYIRGAFRWVCLECERIWTLEQQAEEFGG